MPSFQVISSFGEACVVYYLLVVFLGPFYLLNLVLAIVSASYEQEINMNENDVSSYLFHDGSIVLQN